MTQAPTPDHPSFAPSPTAALGADVGQMYQLLTCALAAWSAYWSACFSARGVADLYLANTELAAQGLTLVGRAAAERQRVHGLVAPTLNDA